MTVYDAIHDRMIGGKAAEDGEVKTDTVPDENPEEEKKNSSNETTSENTPDEENKSGLKHILAPTPRSTPSKRSKKSRGGNNRGVTVLSSARSRHLKKEDGQPFWRKDIQYAFLKALFDNNVKAFTDPFPDSPDNVNMDDREHDPEGRLSFAELYIKSISHSSKCSKVLKERLLNDMKMSIPTCMICLLVNVGRMNTTINFVPDMKSQLRTYHPIPSLQVNYDSSTTGNDKSNDKQLQDTPRLKSILKACCDDTHEPQDLEKLETLDKLPMTTVVNMIFVLCNSEEAVMKKFFADTPYYFFDIFINSSYDPKSRSELFLWLLYNYLETHMTDEDMAKNPFGATKPVLKQAVMDYDVDSALEREFGERLHDQRVKYLEEEGPDKPPVLKTDGTMTWKLDQKPSNSQKDPDDPHADESDETEMDHEHDADQDELMDDAPSEARRGKLDSNKSSTQTASASAPQPVLRQDIDVTNVRKVLRGLRLLCEKRRLKQGVIKHEDFLIQREGTVDDDASNRLRLKNYKGDFGEYHIKFHKLFHKVKEEFYNKAIDDKVPLENKIESDYTGDESEPLKLKSFDI